MKCNKFWPAILTVVLTMASCDDFLDVKTRGIYTPDNYFKNEAAVVDAVTRLYAQLIQESFSGADDYRWDNCSDDHYRAGDHPQDEAIETFTFDASNSQLRSGWGHKYEVISCANNIILNVPGMDNISEPVRSRSMGEAHFFRAFAYWWLYLPYGEVPIISEEDMMAANYNKPKAPMNELLAQIESDLKKAVDYLPDTAEAGRVSKGTAWAYLTQLYMHWASYDQTKLADAINAGGHIVGNPLYALADNFQSNFRCTNRVATTEMLLYVSSSDWRLTNAIRYFTARSPWGGWDAFHPLPGLYEAFGDDPRRIMTLWGEGDIIQQGDEVIEYRASETATTTGYNYNKYTTFLPNGALNFNLLVPLMRSADVYLLVAEAKIRQSGAGAGDAEINAVRARVGLPALSGADKDDLIRERRLELAGEGRRHFDLVRWDKIDWVDLETLYSLQVSAHPADYGRKKFTAPKNYFFPLPQQEIDKSNGVLIQNENYR